MKMKASDYKLPKSELEHLIDEWIFNERNRAIVKKRLLDEEHIDRIAEMFSLSDQQVKNIMNEAHEILCSVVFPK